MNDLAKWAGRCGAGMGYVEASEAAPRHPRIFPRLREVSMAEVQRWAQTQTNPSAPRASPVTARGGKSAFC